MLELLITLGALTMTAAPADSSELVLKGPDFALPATLTLPDAPGPCVVFFAGSGPTDRDWCSPMLPGSNGSAAQLATALRAQGIGSLRFDKVGSGANSKPLKVLSLAHYVAEMTLAYEHLSATPACTRVYLLGHSEGAMHATSTAVALQKRADFGGLMHLAGTSESLVDTMASQLTAQALAMGMTQEAAKAVMDRFRDGLMGLPESAKTPPDLSAFPVAGQLFGSLAAQAMAPVFQVPPKSTQKPFPVALILADPLVPIQAYKGRLLVMSAARDAQVPPHHGAAITKVSPSKDKAVTVIADANHVFKHEPRDPTSATPQALMSAYTEAGRPLAKGFVDAIATFIKGTK